MTLSSSKPIAWIEVKAHCAWNNGVCTPEMNAEEKEVNEVNHKKQSLRREGMSVLLKKSFQARHPIQGRKFLPNHQLKEKLQTFKIPL